jgi:hypothetical protein
MAPEPQRMPLNEGERATSTVLGTASHATKV